MKSHFNRFVDCGILRSATVCALLFLAASTGYTLAAPCKAAPRGDPNLLLGSLFERHDRLDQAEGAYMKALESQSEETQVAALAGLVRIAHRRDSLRYCAMGYCAKEKLSALLDQAISPALIVIAGLIGAAIFSGSVRIGRWLGWFGRDRMEVLPLVVADKEWNGEHFRAIVGSLLGKMRPRPEFLIGDTKLPILVPDWSEYGGSVATVLVPGKAGQVLERLARILLVPEYSLRGSLHLGANEAHLVVQLYRFGIPVTGWERTCSPVRALDELKDAAYAALLAIHHGEGRPV